MSSTSVKVTKSGKFKTGNELRRAVETLYSTSLKRAGLILEGGVKGETPVRTGNLRRTTNTSAPAWEGSIYQVKVGPNAVYARPVNSRGKSRGYIKRGIDRSKARAKAELRQGKARLELGTLWISG